MDNEINLTLEIDADHKKYNDLMVATTYVSLHEHIFGRYISREIAQRISEKSGTGFVMSVFQDCLRQCMTKYLRRACENVGWQVPETFECREMLNKLQLDYESTFRTKVSWTKWITDSPNLLMPDGSAPETIDFFANQFLNDLGVL